MSVSHDSVSPTVATAVGAELGDEEHVADGEHALHDHLQHHRDGEDEDRARDGALR